jgi:hypothetical protein
LAGGGLYEKKKPGKEPVGPSILSVTHSIPGTIKYVGGLMAGNLVAN